MNKFYLPIIITSLLLTSCSPKNDITVNVIKDENIKYDENKQDYKDYTVSLTLDNLSKKISDKDDFVLIFYGSNCLACKSIKPYIINYITTSQYVFYSLEYDYSLDDKYYEEVLNSLYEFPSIAFPLVKVNVSLLKMDLIMKNTLIEISKNYLITILIKIKSTY